MYYLATEAGHPTNGTAYETREEMLAAVRSAYGDDCDFGITEGYILDGGDERTHHEHHHTDYRIRSSPERRQL